MKKLMGLMAGSAGASALQLIALTLAASKVDLRELDVYFLYRDASESILKLLFVSQIGPICVAAMRESVNPLGRVRRALLFGGLSTALALATWTLVFPLIAHHFLSPQAPALITGSSLLELSIVAFCLFTWLDAIASTVLVQRQQFAVNHGGNLLNGALVCLWMLPSGPVSVSSMALAYAVGKAVGTVPKIVSCWWPGLAKQSPAIDVAFSPSVPAAAARHQAAPRTIVEMALPYTASNVLLQFNKFAYLAGTAFLSPGLFALFSIYRRYYTSLQNLVTLNLFNLSAARLVESAQAPAETVKLLDRHMVSFLSVFAAISLLMLFCSLPPAASRLPEFLTTPYVSLLWSVILLAYLPDGVNFMLSRASMLKGDLAFDTKLNSIQALVNLCVLYVSMRFFGIAGLVYTTLLVCTIFAAARLWRLRQEYSQTTPAIIRTGLYGLPLALFSTLGLVVPPWSYCMGMLALSCAALLHLRYVLRNAPAYSGSSR
jgi:hypothetical protein